MKFFFFSSRRRHTRFDCDWSSDVCSSDLVFEGERVYNGKVFRLEDHNERLHNSARVLGFEVPASMDDLAKATEELISANNIVDGYVRPIAWRGAEQMGVS